MNSIWRIQRLIVFAFIVTASLGLAAQADCSSKSTDKKTITLTDKDNGSEISLAKGDSLVVKLEMQASTGYNWQITQNDATVLQPQGEPTYEHPNPEEPGATEYRVFKFLAKADGVSALQIGFSRPWEKDKPPAKTFKAKVQVK